MKKQFLLLTVLLFLLGACAPKPAEHSFIKVNADGQFVRDGKPYYFVGTNFWYGAILGSEGEGGNRERLHKELDFLKSIGINNLRVLVGADGENGIKTRGEPSLQVAPGVYNDTILAGLDYFMNELRERDMTAVLYLNNSWEWSGGYSVYLQWLSLIHISEPTRPPIWSMSSSSPNRTARRPCLPIMSIILFHAPIGIIR